MINDANIWLERLSSLHKSQMRKAASAEGMQLVHLEILHYLSICNKYSNTAQALSEYLGQTKGSISQSLKCMEDAGYIRRTPCTHDGRIIRIALTGKGKSCLKRMNNAFMPDIQADSLKQLLIEWLGENDMRAFGQCQSCHFNRTLPDGTFQCGLTKDSLSRNDTRKICREHAFERA